MAITETGGNGRDTIKFHASNVGNSPYFTREDVGDGLVGTISGVIRENVSPPDEPADMKWVVEFIDHVKKLVLNITRTRQITKIAGGPSEEEWICHRIEMFDDPTVEYKGKEVGGTRVRKPKVEAEAKQASADTEAESDDIEF